MTWQPLSGSAHRDPERERNSPIRPVLRDVISKHRSEFRELLSDFQKEASVGVSPWMDCGAGASQASMKLLLANETRLGAEYFKS
jgi:hypothetical protein